MKRVLTGLLCLLLALGYSADPVLAKGKAYRPQKREQVRALSQKEVDQVFRESAGDVSVAVMRSASLGNGLTTCKLAITSGGGYLKVAFQTTAGGTASRIGIRDLKLQTYERSSWKTIYPAKGTYIYSKSKTGICKGGFKISKKAAKKKYRVTAKHFAVIKGKTYTKNKTTSVIVY